MISKSFSTYDIIRKWGPVISNKFEFKNKPVSDIICIYAEWFGGGETLPNELLLIYDRCISFSKIEIVGAYINPISGNKEYKLSNGNFTNHKFEYIPSTDELYNIFGKDFIDDEWNRIVEISPIEFRNRQLDKLL